MFWWLTLGDIQFCFLIKSSVAIPGFFEIQPLPSNTQSTDAHFILGRKLPPTRSAHDPGPTAKHMKNRPPGRAFKKVDPQKESEQRPASYTRNWWICGDLLWKSGTRICWNKKWEGEKHNWDPENDTRWKLHQNICFTSVILSLFWEAGFAMKFAGSPLEQTWPVHSHKVYTDPTIYPCLNIFGHSLTVAPTPRILKHDCSPPTYKIWRHFVEKFVRICASLCHHWFPF